MHLQQHAVVLDVPTVTVTVLQESCVGLDIAAVMAYAFLSQDTDELVVAVGLSGGQNKV